MSTVVSLQSWGLEFLTLDAAEKAARPLRWIEGVILERYSYKQMYNI
jgi:hypothetical protein